MDRKYVLLGQPLDSPIPNVNLGHQLYEHLKQRKRDDIAFRNYVTNQSVSVGKVLNDSTRLAQALIDFGLTSNNIIAICSTNHVNYPTVILGALLAGVPLALVGPAHTEYELENLLKIIEPEVIFCSEMSMEVLTKLKSKNSSLRKVVAIDLEEVIEGVETLDMFLSPSVSDFPIKEVDVKEQIAIIFFSSGTTGLPKAVSVTHYAISAVLTALNHPTVYLPLESDISLGVTPFFHLYGFYQVLRSISHYQRLVVLEHFNPFDYLKCIEEYKIDVIIGVPVLLHFLAKSPIVDQYDLSSLKEAICGSAPIGDDAIQAVKSRLKLQEIRQVYGCTESHMLITVSPITGAKPGYVGTAAPGTKLFIRDIQTGESLPPNREGEICSTSDMVMKGYYNNETATKETFTEDGWLRTGDIGYYDEEGQLCIVDRLKELIKYKGFQVAPAELEAVLMKNPKIADTGVIGKPDRAAGEVPVAFVVKQEDDINESDVKIFLASFLTKKKHLHEVYFIDEIPRTRSGKIMRRELKKILENMIKSKL